ncbi:hypothetical protein IEQ34_006315 [Dendrobium chrysotoxum]|uniref:Uncharacterized protein n=1 Tax=Dendrobium chrysotoxum TaxID=161865 RepID=A0AAV7HBG1_DENCH|nr:hypothetical protein IEQ34_006315 [Dendrobium chrysotoxum]
MDDFPSFCDHCKSLGHSRKECVCLHPHLARDPIRSCLPAFVFAMYSDPNPLVGHNPVGENNMDDAPINVEYVSSHVGDLARYEGVMWLLCTHL